ncbi:MAG TPA: ABC transporter ATP-binding protein [Polyangiaceae bacterium]|mgnify:CR=1 FL=1|jgi:putative ABC transport system ATP-binding protein|nr:MAG: Macrolide export ATP-binding/permease protein MacB [Deltaproteobacteria bacterium ADurb.Bin207]HNS97789.1 ABC transporter ATP-binding protein [Polyangiaceae bacterium]HNZ23921.1 ABC transporter ATP-binding protein [Polyangiaceae bacterium]HOD23344.1 ABC transporter ATP-binding protein [Polyangiaceae bacterium]HOE50067.1 ABC transporter ATP-binding protein [Polyangiaceae bacterium]
MIHAQGLRRAFGTAQARRWVVDNATLKAEPGEFLAVVGPSGSGKSTLLGILGTLDTHYEGQLTIDGRDIRSLSDRELSSLRGEKIGFVFQSFHLLENRSVLDNVAVPLLFARHPPSRRKAFSVLEQVGLSDRAQELTANLSGGQRQRVAIARAIVHGPSLLFCDEPTGNLDAVTAEQIIDLFVSLHRQGGVTVLCATHDERIANIATRVLRMDEGRLREQR